MNDAALRLLRESNRTLVVFPGDGFETLTHDTACIYRVDEDDHITETILTTSMFEPLDDVSAFFNQQIFLAVKPNEEILDAGVLAVRNADHTVVRLVLDGVPDWQCAVLKNRISDQFTAVFV